MYIPLDDKQQRIPKKDHELFIFTRVSLKV